MSLYAALLFVLLSPGVLVTLPGGASKMMTLYTHAAVFAAVWYVTAKPVARMLNRF